MAWGRAGRHILLLPWIYLRAFLPTILIVVVTLAGVALLSVVKGAGVNSLAFLPFSLGILLYIAAYVYGIVIALRLSLAFPASVVEGLTARNAMRRSSQLTKGAKGRIFLMLLLIYAISYAFLFAFYLAAIILFAVGAVAASVLHLQLTAPWSFLGEGFLGICVVAVIFLWITLTWAGLTTALAVIYHDQRVRLEGYDVERMMEAAGMSAPKTSPSGASLAEPGAEGVEN